MNQIKILYRHTPHPKGEANLTEQPVLWPKGLFGTWIRRQKQQIQVFEAIQIEEPQNHCPGTKESEKATIFPHIICVLPVTGVMYLRGGQC